MIFINEDKEMKYDSYFLEIRKIINELDPVGLIDMGAPENEHDYITTNTLSYLLQNKTSDEIKHFIIKSYDRYGFGFDKVVDEYKESFINMIGKTVEKIMEIDQIMKKDKAFVGRVMEDEDIT